MRKQRETTARLLDFREKNLCRSLDRSEQSSSKREILLFFLILFYPIIFLVTYESYTHRSTMIIVDPILTILFSSLLPPYVKYKYSPSTGSNHVSNRQASTIRIPAIVQSNPRFVKPLLILFLPNERKYTAG